MVVNTHPASRSTSLLSPERSTPPTLRYSRDETLTGTLALKSRVFGVRRRFVRLERSVLYIHSQGDDCGNPLAAHHMTQALDVVVNTARSMIDIRLSTKAHITLVFRHDASLLHLWAAALRRAMAAKVETYYKKYGRVGKGHYAVVYEAVDRRTGQKVAIKEVPKAHDDPKVVLYAKREAEIARLVNHDHVVKTIDVFETADTVYIVMEFVEHGTLLEFLAGGRNRINEKNALRFAKQLLRAIAYLHAENIVHRDVKPENILITGDGQIKLADFGLARMLDGICNDEYCLSSILGTPAYCSPEVVTKSQYGKPVDLYGCGVLLYVALSGSLPFRGTTPEEVFMNIRRGKLEFPTARWALVSEEAMDLVKQLLSYNPADRPTAVEAMNHPWVVSNGDRVSDERPISPRPFVRNTSARQYASGKLNVGRVSRVTPTSSFRRAASGSLKQLGEGRQRRMGHVY
eukprot:GFKZ01007187.1.p1 GENE.GFKZ01007187.1~~GFKZ01007187.1.p1  ORF type:complete len:472 (-),score=71.28 GFKZ01007187.1:191-1570(-)